MSIGGGKKVLGLYQLGRLCGYIGVVLLGSILGHLIVKKLAPIIQSSAAIIFLLFFIYLGVRIFLRKNIQVEFKWTKRIHHTIFSLFGHGDRSAAFILGASSVLLPCGLLYALIAAIVSMNNIGLGVLSVALFWLGSAPATFLAPQIFKKILSPLTKKSPRLIGIVIILVAGAGLGQRVSKISMANPTDTKEAKSCH
jgi:sulfite exporter TauE/SafE